MGIIVSIYDLGCFAGCILNFFVAEWLGRRRAMWFAMCWIIVCRMESDKLSMLTWGQIGATLQCSSYSVPQLMVARFITGIGTGIDTSTVPMYQVCIDTGKGTGRIC